MIESKSSRDSSISEILRVFKGKYNQAHVGGEGGSLVRLVRVIKNVKEQWVLCQIYQGEVVGEYHGFFELKPYDTALVTKTFHVTNLTELCLLWDNFIQQQGGLNQEVERCCDEYLSCGEVAVKVFEGLYDSLNDDVSNALTDVCCYLTSEHDQWVRCQMYQTCETGNYLVHFGVGNNDGGTLDKELQQFSDLAEVALLWQAFVESERP